MSMRQAIASAAILLGIALLGAHYFTGDPGGARFWTEEDQQAYQQASLEFHKLAHAPAPPPGKARKGISADDLETARQRFEVERRRLELARSARGRESGMLFWGGLSAIALGIGGAVWPQQK
jgi:hypothetical protein